MKTAETASQTSVQKEHCTPLESISPTSESRGLKRGVTKVSAVSHHPVQTTFALLGFYEECHAQHPTTTDDGVYVAKWNRKAKTYDSAKFDLTFLQDKLSKNELETVISEVLPSKNRSLGQVLDNWALLFLFVLVFSAILTVVLHLCKVLVQKGTTAGILICIIVVILTFVCWRIKQANTFLMNWNLELELKIQSANSKYLLAKDVTAVKSTFGSFVIFQFHSEMLPEPAAVGFTFPVKQYFESAEQYQEGDSHLVESCWKKDAKVSAGTQLTLHREISETAEQLMNSDAQKADGETNSEEP